MVGVLDSLTRTAANNQRSSDLTRDFDARQETLAFREILNLER